MTPIGSIVMWPDVTPPTDWLVCNGAILAIDDYPALYGAMNGWWQNGDEPAGKFRLPDLRGRFPLGAGEGPGLSSRELAEQGGAEAHTLTIPEMPQHSHSANYDAAAVGTAPAVRLGASSTPGFGLSLTGGGQPHPNMPPWVGVLFIIRAK